MADFNVLVNAIENKVKALIEQNEALKNEVEKLRSTCERDQQQLGLKDKKIEELTEKNKILRIATGGNEGDNREIKLKINEIVREVDKCIAQLNQ